MSIWASVGVDEPEILALANVTDDSNYRAQGQPTVTIDVATPSGYHDHIRLALWDDAGRANAEVLLSPESVRRLRDRLTVALNEIAGGAPDRSAP